MSGIANWQAQIRIDIKNLKKRIKVAEGEINNFTNEDRKVKLDIDTKTLESAIQKLDKMLDSLGKGTGDFKQFENLSKELSSIVSEVQSLSKTFGKVDDSGAKTLLSSIQNIDKSLSELSQNILNVNKNMSNIGGNTSGAVKQAENISNAYQDAAKEAEKLADAQSKIGQKTNISSGMKDAFPSTGTKLDEAVTSAKDLDKTLEQVDIPTDSFDKVLEKLDRTKSELVDIVKITKQSVSDADGKFHDSYTLKDSRGSTEIYGVNSKTNKGQILRQNIVGYDSNAIAKLAQEEEKLTEAMAKGREQSEKARQAEQKRQELAQNNAINKALEEEYRQRQKLAQEEEKQIQKNKELALSYTESASKKLSDAISKYSYGDSFDAKSMMQQMNRGLVNFGDLSNIEVQIKTFDSIIDKIIADLKQSSTETEAALNKEIQQEELKQKQKDSFNKSNLNAIDMEIQKREELGRLESARIKAQMTSREALLSQLQTSIKNYEDIYIAKENKTKSSEWTPNVKYTENLKALAAANKELSDFRTSMSRVSNWSAEQIDEMNRLIANCENAANAFKLLSAAEKGFKAVSVEKAISKINQLLKENPKYSQKAKAELNALLKQLQTGDITNTTLSKIEADILRIKNAEEAAKRSGNSFMSIFKNKAVYGFIGQMQSYLSMYLGFYGIINKIRSTITTVKELDTALIDLKKTTSMNSVQLESFYYDSNDVARQMGVTTKEIIEQASAWSRFNKIDPLYSNVY